MAAELIHLIQNHKNSVLNIITHNDSFVKYKSKKCKIYVVFYENNITGHYSMHIFKIGLIFWRKCVIILYMKRIVKITDITEGLKKGYKA